MREIVGATAVIEGKATSISGVRVLGRYRLQVRLTKPLGDLTARLTMPFFCPILPNTPADRELVTDPPGSGPYYVAERIPNQRLVLRRNPHYRGARPAHVDRVIVTSETAEDCLLRTEQDRIDYCQFGIPATLYPLLAAQHGINRPGGRFFVHPTLETRFVAFNHARPAFKGPGQIPLKQAINYAIDRTEVASAFGLSSGPPTDQLLPAALGRPASIYPTVGADYAAARRLLARATHRPTRLVLYADNAPTGVAVARIVVSTLKQIGIEVEVKHFDFTVLPERVAASGEPFDLALGGWIADYPDPATFFVPLLAHGSRVWGINLDDPLIDRRIEAANRLSGEARRKAWADLDVDLMRENPPWAPLVYYRYPIVVSRSTSCIVGHPVYLFDIVAACKK
jgi:ABC-type oligopeptide transport system substrate-binding subunit